MINTVVQTDRGRVRGIDLGGVVSFRGVPFAAPPEGLLRFRPPVPAAGWEGVRDCGAFGSAPPQLAPLPGVPSVWRPEAGLDCLSLNVWSPDLGAARLPVMVWIHGGLWKYGGSSMPQYDAATLAGSGVVVVTVNYRVGFEGFGHLPGVPENRGLRDQIAALEWVGRNIAAFGGDPGKVTVFGQSAGAASVALLVATRATDGLFRRAIAQSIPSGYLSVAEAERVTASIAAAAGVETTWEGFAALPPEAILAVQDAPLTGRDDGSGVFGPVIDGDLVSGPPWTALSAGARRDVELICGFTHEEYNGMGGRPGPSGIDLEAVAGTLRLGDRAAADYRRAHPTGSDADLFTVMLSDALIRMPTIWTAEAHTRAGGRTWMYDFAWRGSAIGAGHGADVPFVFGNGGTRYAARFLGSPPHADFAPLSEQMRTAWTAFAATGDPGWPGYDLQHRLTRIWDTVPGDRQDPIAASRRIWEHAEPR
ncbi:carboxylesterase/lipase family protein [Thermomonospora echinospora]|uniref:carboxylesterase/lipase family protein n=1 Tax=Thermomonospora echinospora TaxID=1992 RepID=UPI001F319AB1|nr:carboxylesterase family protein [Thermomonospora echinospora]